MPPLIRRWAQRRTVSVDQARVEFFDLSEGEFPVEGWEIEIISVWPGAFGRPMRPSEAAKVDAKAVVHGPEWGGLAARRLPLHSVLLLTESRLAWCPYRAYRGRLVYQQPVDQVLAEGKGAPSNAVYSRFPHPSLGIRAIDLASIRSVDLIMFSSGDVAVVNIYFDGVVDGREQGWPLYDLRLGEEVASEAEPIWEGGSADRSQSFLQVSATGSASLNVWSIAPAFDHVGVPFRTDFVGSQMTADWEELSAIATWEPLPHRLA